MKWRYEQFPFVIVIEFCDSKTRGSQLYGYLEGIVLGADDIRLYRAQQSVSGFSMSDIEIKARSWAKKLAIQVAAFGGDFTPD